MTTVNTLLQSSTNLANCIPISAEQFHNYRDGITLAYTGYNKDSMWAVWTNEKPYIQYIIVMDLKTWKIIS